MSGADDPIVVLHGFAGHAASWTAVKSALPHREVVAITLYGHDPAAPAREPVTFEEEVDRVGAELSRLGRPARVCGYSMGGRITLGLLARAPELVASAVLVGAHPGLTNDAERAAREDADAVWVHMLEAGDLEAFAEKWQAQGLFASQSALDPARLAAQRAVRVGHDARSLALAMSSLGLARMPSWWDSLGRIRVPVDFLVGSLDEKFAALALRMHACVPKGLGRVVHAAGAGHNVVIERPELLARLLADGPSAEPPAGMSVVAR